MIKRLLKKILNRYDLYAPFLLRVEGPLHDDGWFRSYREQKPLDAGGNPLPWVSYPFIDFIAPRLNTQLRLFEFGSGHSTLWYAGRVLRVVSVEHDRGWYEEIRRQMPGNVTISYVPLEYGGTYCRTAVNRGEQFDIIVVDGRDRVNSMINSVDALSERGVMVLDDSERPQYEEGIAFLTARGFRRIDFWGMAPGLLYKKCTSLLYRDGNCLGI